MSNHPDSTSLVYKSECQRCRALLAYAEARDKKNTRLLATVARKNTMRRQAIAGIFMCTIFVLAIVSTRTSSKGQQITLQLPANYYNITRISLRWE